MTEVQNKPKKRGSRTAAVLTAAAVSAAFCAGFVWHVRQTGQENSNGTTYREETAVTGSLTVGITEEGTIAVGTSEQTFDLDLSAYTGTSSGYSSGTAQNGGGGADGMNMAGGMNFGMNQTGSSSSSSSGSRALTVESVLVSEGQTIEAGDPVADISADSAESIRTELEEDVNSAALSLQEAGTSQKSTRMTADTQAALWQTYGTYAQAEYDAAVQDLQDAVDEAQDAVDEDQENLSDLQEQLTQAKADLEDDQKLLKNAEYAKSRTDRETELYSWVSAENTREDAQSLADETQDEIDSLEDQIETQTSTLQSDTRTLNAAKEAYDTGVVSAKAEYDSKMLYYSSASTYNAELTGQSSLAVEIAQTAYDKAARKLEEFDSYISGGQILAQYSGTVESVEIAEGDALSTGSAILTVTDSGDLSVGVSVSADDIQQVAEGDSVKISIDAYPDDSFTGTVEKIGDSSYNSSTGETEYAVTVALDDTDADLYSGMSAQVTFVTKDEENVLYIPNRAVTRENGRSYVLKKASDGSAVKTEITTGFSDGTDVQVTDGLSEGDTVLIESQAG